MTAARHCCDYERACIGTETHRGEQPCPPTTHEICHTSVVGVAPHGIEPWTQDLHPCALPTTPKSLAVRRQGFEPRIVLGKSQVLYQTRMRRERPSSNQRFQAVLRWYHGLSERLVLREAASEGIEPSEAFTSLFSRQVSTIAHTRHVVGRVVLEALARSSLLDLFQAALPFTHSPKWSGREDSNLHTESVC